MRWSGNTEVIGGVRWVLVKAGILIGQTGQASPNEGKRRARCLELERDVAKEPINDDLELAVRGGHSKEDP